MWLLAGTLDAVVSSLDAQIVPEPALTQVRALLARFPAALSDWVYLECRLWPRNPRVDVIVRVNRSQAEPSWPDASDDIWLEFDLPADRSAADAPPTPRIFIDFTTAADRPLRPSVSRELIGEFGDRFGLAPPPPSVLDLVDRCLHALPPGASLLSLGFPATAAHYDLRLSLIGISDSRLPAFLESIGWPGDIDGLRALMASLARPASGPRGVGILDLNLDAGIQRRIGLEYTLARRPQLRGAIAESDFLDALITRGLANPEAVGALRRWPGRLVMPLPHTLWPAVITRRVNHVKVVFDADHVTEVKAYACFFHRPAAPIAFQLYSASVALDWLDALPRQSNAGAWQGACCADANS